MKTKLISLILICGLALTACTNSSEEQNTVPTDSTSAESEEITEIKADEAVEESKAKTENAYPEFTGIDISDEALTVSTVNNRTAGFPIFAYSEDMIYFSDIKDCWKLYSYDGENVSLITDMQAYYLYYYDKNLYFLSADEAMDIYGNLFEGILYKYDTESKEITQISDDPVYNPRIDITGIYYAKKYDDKFYIYRLDEESGGEERLFEGLAPYRIDSYYIAKRVSNTSGKYDYFFVNGNEEICLAYDVAVVCDFIHNGVFYYVDQDLQTHSVDLRTGERNTMSIGKRFAVLDDEIYFIEGKILQSLYRWKDGNAERIRVDSIIDSSCEYLPLYQIQRIYADNKSLYAIVYDAEINATHEYYMAKLEPSEDDSGNYVLHILI